MPSIFSHAIAGLSVGSAFYRPHVAKRVFVAAAVCSAIPDLDVIGFRFGVHYGDFWGHHGFTHSLMFAAVLSVLVAWLLLWRRSGMRRAAAVAYLFLATAAHGFLDAMTNGGLGVAFFSPFNNHRYFLPWRPIHVAPLSVGRFFTARGLSILRNEILWIWLPSLLFAVLVLAVRSPRSRSTTTPDI